MIITDIVKNSGFAGRMFSLLFISLLCLLVFMGIAFGFGFLIWGDSFTELIGSQDFGLKRVVAAQLWLQAVSTLGLFVGSSWLFAWFISDEPSTELALNRLAKTRSFVWSAVLMVGAIPLVTWLYSLNQLIVFPEPLGTIFRQMEDQALLITNGFLSQRDVIFFIINILVIAILPAIGEEMFFRGVIQKQLSGRLSNPHIAIWISALIFSAIHLQFYGLFPRLVLGLFLGYLFWWSGSLWLAIFAHFVNNAFAVLVKYFGSAIAPIDAEKFSFLEESNIKYAFFSTLLIAVMLYGIYFNEKTKKNNKNDELPVE